MDNYFKIFLPNTHMTKKKYPDENKVKKYRIVIFPNPSIKNRLTFNNPCIHYASNGCQLEWVTYMGHIFMVI